MKGRVQSMLNKISDHRRDDEYEHDQLIECAEQFGDKELLAKLKKHSEETDKVHLELIEYLQKKL